MQKFNSERPNCTSEMKKVFIVTTVSLGIVLFSFLIPILIVPTYLKVAHIGSCADFMCAENAFQKCEANWSRNSTGAAAVIINGVGGLYCMWDNAS